MSVLFALLTTLTGCVHISKFARKFGLGTHCMPCPSVSEACQTRHLPVQIFDSSCLAKICLFALASWKIWVRIFDQDRCQLASIRSGENSSLREPSRLLLPCKSTGHTNFLQAPALQLKINQSKVDFSTLLFRYLQAHALHSHRVLKGTYGELERLFFFCNKQNYFISKQNNLGERKVSLDFYFYIC